MNWDDLVYHAHTALMIFATILACGLFGLAFQRVLP